MPFRKHYPCNRRQPFHTNRSMKMSEQQIIDQAADQGAFQAAYDASFRDERISNLRRWAYEAVARDGIHRKVTDAITEADKLVAWCEGHGGAK